MLCIARFSIIKKKNPTTISRDYQNSFGSAAVPSSPKRCALGRQSRALRPSRQGREAGQNAAEGPALRPLRTDSPGLPLPGSPRRAPLSLLPVRLTPTCASLGVKEPPAHLSGTDGAPSVNGVDKGPPSEVGAPVASSSSLRDRVSRTGLREVPNPV